jgi:hypothetical protein
VKLTPFGRFLVILGVLGTIALLVIFVAIPLGKNIANKITATNNQPTVQEPQTPGQNTVPTTVKQPTKAPNQSSSTSQPTAKPIVQNPSTDNTPDTRPVITVGEDQFGSYFVLQQIAEDKTLPFQVNVVPFGFNDEVGNPSEQDRGKKLANGEYDVLLTTSASLSRMGNIGKVIFFVDQSNGADKIIVKNIASNGSPILTFNDLKGKSICVANGNVNHFAILAALRVAGISPTEVTWIKSDNVPSAVDNFIQGKCDVVGAWEPEASRASKDGAGNTLVDSKWWNNITDVAVSSNQALSQKPELMKAFTAAWMKYAKMQSENLKLSGEQIAAWTFQGQPSNDWTFIYPGSEESDMHIWLDTIAQAGLVENMVAMQNIGYFKLQVTAARDAWSKADMIVDIVPYDLDTLVYPDFINQLGQDPSLINGGTFANPNYQPIPEELPNAEASQLLGVSTVVKLPCETFTFKENSNQLSDKGKQEVQACAAAARDMILSSQGQILITGSSAWPAGYNEVQIYNMANARAMSVYQEFLRMGIPVSRMAIYVSLPPLEHRNIYDDNILKQYRYVRLEIKVLGK